MPVQGVQQQGQITAFGGDNIEDDGSQIMRSHLHHLGCACERVTDPMTEGSVQTQVPELGKQYKDDYGIGS